MVDALRATITLGEELSEEVISCLSTVVVNAAQLAPQALAYLGECVEGVLLATKSLSPLILASLQTGWSAALQGAAAIAEAAGPTLKYALERLQNLDWTSKLSALIKAGCEAGAPIAQGLLAAISSVAATASELAPQYLEALSRQLAQTGKFVSVTAMRGLQAALEAAAQLQSSINCEAIMAAEAWMSTKVAVC